MPFYFTEILLSRYPIRLRNLSYLFTFRLREEEERKLAEKRKEEEELRMYKIHLLLCLTIKTKHLKIYVFILSTITVLRSYKFYKFLFQNYLGMRNRREEN